jgi:hypothetical protein
MRPTTGCVNMGEPSTVIRQWLRWQEKVQGGNLAGAISMIARQRNQALPVQQILIYPVTGYDMDTPSYRKHAQAQPLNKAMMAWFFEKYFNSPADANNPMVALIKAQDLKGLPPATIITAGMIRCSQTANTMRPVCARPVSL